MNDKILWSLCLGALLILRGGEPEAPQHFQAEVDCVNGDRFTGDVHPTAGAQLQMKCYWLETELPINFGEIQGFQRMEPFADIPEGELRVEFRSGKFIILKSLRMEEDEFVGEALWGGEIRMSRAALKGLTLLHPQGLLYEGPVYQLPGQKEKIRQPLLITRPGLQWESEALKFPENFLLEIEMETPTNAFVYQVSLFDWKNRGEGSVVFQFTPEQVSAAWYQRISPNRLSVQNWNVQVASVNNTQKLEFYYNQKAGSLTLFLNGKALETWEGDLTASLRVENPFSIGFRYMQGNAALKISNIQMLPWGDVPPQGNEAKPLDQLTFVGGQQIIGTLQALDMKTLMVLPEGKDTVVSMPTERLLNLQVSTENIPENTALPEDAGRLYYLGIAEPLKVYNVGLRGGNLHAKVWSGTIPFGISIPLTDVRRFEALTRQKP